MSVGKNFYRSILFSLYLCLCAQPARADYMLGKQAVSDQVGDQYNKLIELRDKGNYKDALPVVTALVKSTPNVAAIRVLCSEILVRNGDMTGANTEAQAATKLDPGFGLGWVAVGNVALYSGKKSEALAAFKKAAQILPKGQNSDVLELIKALEAELRDAVESSVPSPNGTYLNEATIHGVKRWTADKMPLRVYIASGKGIKGYQDSFEVLLKKSFLLWAEKSDGAVKIQFVDQKENANIECSWTNDVSKLQTPLEGGHTIVADTAEGRVQAVIVLLTESPLLVFTDSVIERLCLHEIGHALGITGHSSDPKDIMYLSEVGGGGSLSDADIATLKALYTLAPSIKTRKSHGVERIGKGTTTDPESRAINLCLEAEELDKQGKLTLACVKYREALKLSPKFKAAHINLIVLLNNQSITLINQQKYAAAKPLLEEAIRLQETYGPSERNKMQFMLQNYHVLLSRMGNRAEADKALLRLKSLEKSPTGGAQ